MIDKRNYDLTPPRREKPVKTYTQDWPAYNAAKTNEKMMFLNLLRELVDSVPLIKEKSRGSSLNFRDMIFSLCLSMYSGMSSRRATSELEVARDLGFISKKPHFNSLLNYFHNEGLTKPLQDLITISSLPLKGVERCFAADASGFSLDQFGRWFEFKWGKKDGRKKGWVKAHVMAGTKTHTITSIEVTKSNVNDTVMFPALVEKTGKHFWVREISADKAYTSRKNLELVASLNAVPFIPFKKNHKGNSRGSHIWSKMFDYFWLKTDEFYDHYHKRSNAETVFAMMKRKFSPMLRTRNFTSQTNEVLTMAICHNLCVLIQEIFELGIEVNFFAQADQYRAQGGA